MVVIQLVAAALKPKSFWLLSITITTAVDIGRNSRSNSIKTVAITTIATETTAAATTTAAETTAAAMTAEITATIATKIAKETLSASVPALLAGNHFLRIDG